jgi:hypothetical protein
MDYFTELSQNYTGFQDIANRVSAEDRKDPGLQALAEVVLNSLRIHRKGLANQPDYSRSSATAAKEDRAEYLSKIRNEFDTGISIFFDRFQKNADTLQQGLRAVERPKQPESSTEIALQAEVRSRMREMSVSERLSTLQKQSNAGDFRVFEAIENDPMPIANFLGNPDESSSVLADARGAYVRSRYGEAWQNAQTATHNLEIAKMTKDIAEGSGLVENEVSVGGRR